MEKTVKRQGEQEVESGKGREGKCSNQKQATELRPESRQAPSTHGPIMQRVVGIMIILYLRFLFFLFFSLDASSLLY